MNALKQVISFAKDYLDGTEREGLAEKAQAELWALMRRLDMLEGRTTQPIACLMCGQALSVDDISGELTPCVPCHSPGDTAELLAACEVAP